MKTASRNIALFMPAFAGGGAERVMLELAEAFAGRGLRVDLVVTSARGPLRSEVPKGVTVVDLKASRIILSVWALVRYLRRERPHALLSAMTSTNVVALLARRLARVQTRVVISEHNTLSVVSRLGAFKRAKFLPLLAKLLYPTADSVVAVSNGVADDLAKSAQLSRSRIEVIYNPVFTRRFSALSQVPLDDPWFAARQPPVVLGVGRLTAQKDFSTLLRAFSRVRERINSRLLILGDGEERELLEKLAAQLGVQNDVRLPGFVENPYPYMREAGVLALSSRWEGFGLVLAEALAFGTPVVSTDCPSGPHEILEGGLRGRLVPVGDEIALSRAIQEALLVKETPDSLQWRSKAFSIETAAARYCDVLLLQERSK